MPVNVSSPSSYHSTQSQVPTAHHPTGKAFNKRALLIGIAYSTKPPDAVSSDSLSRDGNQSPSTTSPQEVLRPLNGPHTDTLAMEDLLIRE